MVGFVPVKCFVHSPLKIVPGIEAEIGLCVFDAAMPVAGRKLRELVVIECGRFLLKSVHRFKTPASSLTPGKGRCRVMVFLCRMFFTVEANW